MKKYFLTTALMGTFIAPAFGADKIITSANTCTVDVLGVSDNNATANTIATWSLNEYTLNPGEYLNVTETDVAAATCPAGSYCVGGTGFTVDNAQISIAQCPTGYPNSANGASADTQCYTACTVATANIAHATAVSGNDYFGSGVDTCGATACETGYHVKPGLNISEEIGDVLGEGYGYINNYGSFTEYREKSEKGQDYYGISDKNSFAVDYAGKGLLTGHGRCSTQEGTNNDWTWTDPTIVNNLTDEMGQEGAQYCYCQLDGYTPASGDKVMVTSAPWLFLNDYDSADICASVCAEFCGYGLLDVVSYRVFRAAVMNSLPALPATCEANTINIDWNPDNGGEHIKNMCTYEGEITLPTPDPVKPGYTFTGWKLVE